MKFAGWSAYYTLAELKEAEKLTYELYNMLRPHNLHISFFAVILLSKILKAEMINVGKTDTSAKASTIYQYLKDIDDKIELLVPEMLKVMESDGESYAV